MVSVGVSAEKIRREVKLLDPNWGTRALSQGEHWSTIKPALLDLQNYKCCYCESEIGGRPNEAGVRSLVSQDVEHFRPKAQVTPWTFPPEWGATPPSLADGPADGYPWLRHHELNYGASCKDCNTTFKGNRFPIRRRYENYASRPDPQQLDAQEQPLLILPLAEWEQPERVLTFLGWDATPHQGAPDQDYWRAVACIEILGLNRQDLLIRRRKVIRELSLTWAVCRFLPEDKRSQWLQINPDTEFVGCRRAYLRLCQENAQLSLDLALKACEEEHDREFLQKYWRR